MKIPLASMEWSFFSISRFIKKIYHFLPFLSNRFNKKAYFCEPLGMGYLLDSFNLQSMTALIKSFCGCYTGSRGGGFFKKSLPWPPEAFILLLSETLTFLSTWGLLWFYSYGRSTTVSSGSSASCPQEANWDHTRP